MSKLGKKMEEMWSAAAFAEAGELDTARELLAGNEKVLLVLTGSEGDVKACKYALNMAKRTGAAVELLVTSTDEQTTKLLEAFREELRREAVASVLSSQSGCIKELIVNHAKKRNDILCVVVESNDAWSAACSPQSKGYKDILRKLGCPLVLVSEK